LCRVRSDTPIRMDGCSAAPPIISNIISSQSARWNVKGLRERETGSSARARVGKRKKERAERLELAQSKCCIMSRSCIQTLKNGVICPKNRQAFKGNSRRKKIVQHD
jgi:hypothetical protein